MFLASYSLSCNLSIQFTFVAMLYSNINLNRQGTYMIVYNQNFANMLHSSVIMQSLLIWTTSLFMGGIPAAVSLALSCLSIIFVWIFSIGFSVVIAFILPLISSSPVPYVGSPWLVIGLFVAPAVLGALMGQHFGYIILKSYLSNVYSKKKQLSPVIQADLVKLEAERWLFKAGFIQWLVLLILGTYYNIGSSYMALVWLVPPAFACKWTLHLSHEYALESLGCYCFEAAVVHKS